MIARGVRARSVDGQGGGPGRDLGITTSKSQVSQLAKDLGGVVKSFAERPRAGRTGTYGSTR